MGVRFLHLADLHLGSDHSYLGDHAKSRSREVLETFRKAVTLALDPARRIDAVLIAGNLFERHRPDAETWAYVRGLLGRLAAEEKPVFVVPGARDSYAYKDSVYRTERWPGAELLVAPLPGEPVHRVIAGTDVHLYGVAAQPGLSPRTFGGFTRTQDEGVHIGLLNGALVGHRELDIRPHDHLLDPEVLARTGLDYLALGGYHEHTPLRFGDTLAAYPGTLEGRRFEPGDLGRKSLLIVEVEPGNVSFERIPVSARVLEEWTIHLRDERITDAGALAAALLARASEDVIARVVLEGPLEFLCDVERLADEVADRFHHLEIADRTTLLGSALLNRLEGEGTIRGYFVRRMLRRIAELEARALTAAPDAPVHRDVEIARMALRLGLEQFLEEEPMPGLRAASEPAVEALAPARAILPPRKVDVGAHAEMVGAASGRNGGGVASSERQRALLLAERRMADAGSGSAEGEGA